MDASQIGKRAWSYAGVLQDVGLSCFEYVEQLTLLLFLKMADQLTEEWSDENPEGRWRSFDYEELLKRDKLSLDLFWIKDKSLTDTDSLPTPEILAQEIADDLETALEQFTKIAAKLARKETV